MSVQPDGEKGGEKGGEKAGEKENANPVRITDTVRLERARWRSRRGLLELELLLTPFVEGGFAALPDDLKVAYESLLDCDDMDIHEWLLARLPVPDEVLPIISEIRRYLHLC